MPITHTGAFEVPTIESANDAGSSLSRRAFLALGVATLLSDMTLSPAKDGVEDGVLELRQYTLRRGQRETLIALFERVFIEPQNAHGAKVLGMFRDVDDPDRFVWIRGFRDMLARKQALEAFYADPVWLKNRHAAGATMLDTDNVLLLKPAAPGQGLTVDARPSAGAADVFVITIHYIGAVDSSAFAQAFDQAVLPELVTAGVNPLARLVSEEAPNDFPRLPVREHERVFAWLARWTSLAQADAFATKLSARNGWRDSLPEAVLPAFMRKPERLRLTATAKSPLQ
jgi:hypothetical protein